MFTGAATVFSKAPIGPRLFRPTGPGRSGRSYSRSDSFLSRLDLPLPPSSHFPSFSYAHSISHSVSFSFFLLSDYSLHSLSRRFSSGARRTSPPLFLSSFYRYSSPILFFSFPLPPYLSPSLTPARPGVHSFFLSFHISSPFIFFVCKPGIPDRRECSRLCNGERTHGYEEEREGRWNGPQG